MSLVAWAAICQHVAWGVLLLTSGELRTTGLAWMIEVCGGPYRAGVLCLVIGLLAVFPHFRSPYRRSLSLLLFYLPQQILLFMSATNAMRAVILQQFADGVIRGWAFILADQLTAVLFAVFHTIALLQFYGILQGRRG